MQWATSRFTFSKLRPLRGKPQPHAGARVGRALLVALLVVAPCSAITTASPASAQSAGSCPPLPAPESGRAIYGQLCQVIDGRAKFASGVKITVSRGGAVVGRAVTDSQGRWLVPVPEGATYQVSLDAHTLRPPFSLTDRSKTVLPSVDTTFGSTRVLFPLGRATAGPSGIREVLKLLGSGIKLGLIIGVAACGLSLIYGATGLINFAHGELVTLGALLTYLFSSTPGFGELWLGLAAAIAVVLVGAAGVGTDLALWSPLRRRHTALLSMMVVSIGLSLLARNVFQIFFGPEARAFRQYAVQKEVSVGPFSLAPKEWAIIAVATVVLIAVTGLIKFTRLGTAIRAVADNRDLAEASGIDVDSVIRWVWFLGSALAALGGVFYGLTQNVKFDMGWLLLLALFAAVVVGGLGSAYGAILGGLLIGIVQQVATYWIDTSYEFAVPLAVLVVVLLFKPRGLLSRRERYG